MKIYLPVLSRYIAVFVNTLENIFMAHFFFSPCPRGLEPLLKDELIALGAESVTVVPGGAAYQGGHHLVYLVNLHSRLATRVLLRQASEKYTDERDIYRIAREVDWPSLFPVTATIRVYITAIHCPLKSLEFAALTVKDAVCDRFRATCGARPSVYLPQPDIRIHVFIEKKHLMLYLDTSGEPLYKRYGRPGHHEAPLKENLAAGLIQLSGWHPELPFIDPMCGSGTFLIEAAQRALNIAPGLQRHFAFERCFFYDNALWHAIREKAQQARLPNQPLKILGTDRYGDVLKIARLNLEAAGLSDNVLLKQVNILEFKPPFKTGTVIMNPPYGIRLEQSTPEFYPALGTRLKQYFADHTVWILSPDLDLPHKIRLRPKRRIPIFNGKIECRLFGFDLISGSFRRQKPDSLYQTPCNQEKTR